MVSSACVCNAFFTIVPCIGIALVVAFLDINLNAVLKLLDYILRRGGIPILDRLDCLCMLLYHDVPGVILLCLICCNLPVLFLTLRSRAKIRIPFRGIPTAFMTIMNLALRAKTCLDRVFQTTLRSMPGKRVRTTRTVNVA